jgi:beta-glucosidase
MEWPDGFLWGTGASSTQCEGASPAGDWWEWEQEGRVPRSGDGNGFATRYAEDFALYASLGLTHHRLSIEWARLEPEPGRHDPGAVAHYRDVLAAARSAGVAPWVTLHHFSLPRWFMADGGFLDERNRTEVWARHVDFVAETFGDLVHGWKPVNETNWYAALGYGLGSIPPGRTDRDEAALAAEAMHLATAEAAVRLRQTGKPVCSIFGLAGLVPLDDTPATHEQLEPLDRLVYGNGLGLFRDGVLQVEGREPVERPDLAGAFDLLGFSFYFTWGVRGGELLFSYPEDAETSPLGYGIWADGLGLVLDRLHEELPGTPILVAEYGVGTPDDDVRAAYVRRGLEITNDALARGIDVAGFFHWTGVDNYEWNHGYDVQFGIVDVERNVRPSAQVLAAEALGERR